MLGQGGHSDTKEVGSEIKKQLIDALVGAIEYYNLHLPLRAGNSDKLESTV